MKLPRLSYTSIIAIALFAALVWHDASRAMDALVKLSLLTMVAVAAYWLDRAVFPYARPGDWQPLRGVGYTESERLVFCAAMLRRVLLIVGAMIAAALVF